MDFDVNAAENFNPLPPHGGRQHLLEITRSRRCISIHSLRMEGDMLSLIAPSNLSLFQSTPSAWRETAQTGIAAAYFYIFQSTPSAWRETKEAVLFLYDLHISIHSLRKEGDGVPLCILTGDYTFQSTPSAWRETPLR